MVAADEGVFLPFQRHDQYGLMGQEKQSPLERARLCFLAITAVPLKVLGTVSCILGFYAACRILQILPERTREFLVPFLGKTYTRLCLFCIGFMKVSWVHLPRADWDVPRGEAQAAGIVSNHCSWIDILVHMSRYFPSFAARGGTEKLPLIGPIRWADTASQNIHIWQQGNSYSIRSFTWCVTTSLTIPCAQSKYGLRICGARG